MEIKCDKKICIVLHHLQQCDKKWDFCGIQIARSERATLKMGEKILHVFFYQHLHGE